MRAVAVLITAVAMLASLGGSRAAADVDASGQVSAGQSFTWEGATETSANPYYFGPGVVDEPAPVGPLQSSTCNTDPYHGCDSILVELVNPLTQDEIDSGRVLKTRRVDIRLTAFVPERFADFDLELRRSDASGTVGPYWTGSAATSQSAAINPVSGGGEARTVEVETTVTEPSKWMLIRVIRYLSPNASYKGAVDF